MASEGKPRSGGSDKRSSKPAYGRGGTGSSSGSGGSGGKPRNSSGSGSRPPHATGSRSSTGRAKQYGERGERPDRPERKVAIDAPEIPEEIEYGQLDKQVRSRLRTLSKENAEDVGRHLIMAGLLIDSDPELAYKHAQVAAARGGRVDVVREAAALTAYATGRYADALRELRTVRRLNGSSEHLALMADCERGLGRPERAIALSQDPAASSLDPVSAVELAIVVAGARVDMGDPEAALVILSRLNPRDGDQEARIAEAKAGVLRALGRDDEAAALEATVPAPVAAAEDEDVIVYDTFEDPPEVPIENEQGH